LHWYCQRFSHNKHQGSFTDVELLTCYFFAIIEEKKYQIKQIYEYIVKYWSDWFPSLPSYQCFNKRINRMGESLPILLGVLSSQLQPITGLVSKDLLLDSVPVILCKGKRQGKVASEMAAKTYSSSKGIYYYGVKLHWMGMSQANRLPMPVWIELTSAAEHDLPPLKAILSNLWHCRLFGDKAYCSQQVEEQLAKQGSEIFCPEKNKKGESSWDKQFNHAFRKLYGRAVSSVRQPIEAFFNWIIEKVDIQNASKVRSSKGLKVHVFGKTTAAILILLGF
ncbi:MAG: transposase, partial [Flammeovirgaceae bacterium]|nr:transposase [Flammeovirgaceae bacterium]